MEGDFSWYVYHVKGNFLMHHLKFNEAIKAFEMSIQANTKDQFSFDFYNIGICYQKLNEFEKSLKYLKKAVFLNPNAVETLNALGFSHSSIKNP